MSTIANPLAWLDNPAEVGQPAETATVATRPPDAPATSGGPGGGPQADDDEPADLPAGVLEGDDELAERVAALSPEGRQAWVEAVRCRQAAGEPSDGVGWRALVDVRIARRGTPDGWPPRAAVAESIGPGPLCRCGSRQWLDVGPDADGTVRRDCARCGRFLAWAVWRGRRL